MGLLRGSFVWAFWVGLRVMFLGEMTRTKSKDALGLGIDAGHVGYGFVYS
jgi:hypothetical protein